MSLPSVFGDRFESEMELVKRGNCVVLKGRDRELGGRAIAIKVFVDKPINEAAALLRFDEEVKRLKSASHHALVPIAGHGLQDGYFYLAMEYVEGSTLRELLREEGAFPITRALDVFREIADALTEIHQAGAVHGHLDSRAIIFKGNRAVLAGYMPGIIEQIQKEATSTGRMSVDPSYVSPEQVSGTSVLDAKADIFSASALLFEMLTGQKPYQADNPLQVAMLRVTGPVPSPAKILGTISPLVDAAVMKGLAKDPQLRFQNFSDMLDALSGGKTPPKNPFAGMSEQDVAERLGTETMTVSMTPDMLKRILSGADIVPTPASAPVEVPQREVIVNSQAVADIPDMQATAVGMKIETVLNGSLVVLQGPKSGEKFVLQQDTTMIGADAACQISVPGKDVPARYAVIMRKGAEYYIDAASKKSLVLNDAAIEEEGERLLKRGDVLTVGESKLRFVAPGEVFTLNASIADRAIDRPKSKVGLILGGIAGLVALAGIFGVYSYNTALEKQQSKKAQSAREKSDAREKMIAKLMSEGDEFFKSGALIEPVGANAKERFASIVELNPDNSYAKRRLLEIDQRLGNLVEQRKRREQLKDRLAQLASDADRYFKQGDLLFPPGRNARDAYQEILRIDPEHVEAKAKIDEINQTISELSGKVRILLARAQVYQDLGQFLKPEKENALEMLQGVLKVDPQNDEARSGLIDMAARTILQGDRARTRADASGMKEAYLVAQAMGVDPKFLEPRMRGVSIMERSKSTVIIYDRPDERAAKDSASADEKFLDSKKLDSRIAALSLAANDKGIGDKIFIDLGTGKR